MAINQVAPDRPLVEQDIDLGGEGSHVLVIGQHRNVHDRSVRVLTAERLDQFIVLETNMAGATV